jgi:hypothetical protein
LEGLTIGRRSNFLKLDFVLNSFPHFSFPHVTPYFGETYASGVVVHPIMSMHCMEYNHFHIYRLSKRGWGLHVHTCAHTHAHTHTHTSTHLGPVWT